MKITFGQMRAMGLRGILVYCHCGHYIALDADQWLDEVRLSDIEPRFVCQGCGARGADVRPDFERGNPRLATWGRRSWDPRGRPTEAALRPRRARHGQYH